MVLQRFALTPGTLSQNLVQVQSHGLSCNKAFYFSFQFVGQNSHQSLGGEPVLGALLVITLGHVFEQIVAGQIDVVNDLAQVTLEIGIGQSNQVIQSVLGNVSLPLKSALTLITELSQVFGTILDVHPSNEGVLELQALSRSGNYKKIEYPIPKSTSILFFT